MTLVHSSVRFGQVNLTRVEGEWGCAVGMHGERTSMDSYSQLVISLLIVLNSSSFETVNKK